jgi:hypothetical protein
LLLLRVPLVEAGSALFCGKEPAMEANGPTVEDLEVVRAMCESSEKSGINWPLMIQLLPTDKEEEEAWRMRMLRALQALGKL